jgi:hypothetical protein
MEDNENSGVEVVGEGANQQLQSLDASGGSSDDDAITVGHGWPLLGGWDVGAAYGDSQRKNKVCQKTDWEALRNSKASGILGGIW